MAGALTRRARAVCLLRPVIRRDLATRPGGWGRESAGAARSVGGAEWGRRGVEAARSGGGAEWKRRGVGAARSGSRAARSGSRAARSGSVGVMGGGGLLRRLR